MAKMKMGLATQMGIALVLGVVAGLVAPLINFPADWFRPFGTLFINGIRMIVVPLVFCTLVAGAASISDISKLGRVAVKTLVYFAICTCIGTTLGLLAGDIFQPGAGLNIVPEGGAPKVTAPPSLVQVLLNIVPINPIKAMSDGVMLQVIFFAIFVGISLSMCGEKVKNVTAFFESFADVMIKMTGVIMLYAPIGVFALMAYTVAAQGMAVLLPLLKVVALMYVSCIIMVCVFFIPCIIYTRIPLRTFFKSFSETGMIAFTTCSSAAALATNLLSAERLGSSHTIASFAIPLGNTINMGGTALYMGLVTIFCSEIFGVPMDFNTQLTVVLMALLAAIGTIGVPGSGMIMITMIFSQVGIPLEAVAIVAGVDRLLDMARTTLNVMGDNIAALVVSKSENDLDPERGASLSQ